MARQELIEASDEVIEDAISHADMLVLRGLLYQLTGDEEVANIPHERVPMGFRGLVPAIVDPEHVALLRGKAFDFLKRYQKEGAGEIAMGPHERLRRSMELAIGDGIPDGDVEMWIEQLGLHPMVRGLNWREQPSPAQREGFKVAVIGAGMGGLMAAVQLKRAGVPFVLIEKNAGVGGTWYENRYPGARVDSLSRVYFNAFGANFECPASFCLQEVQERYFNWVADHFGIRDDIVFDTEVKSLRWDEAGQRWDIDAVGPAGGRRWTVNAVITAVGYLARPNVAEIPGVESFEGPKFHTARWPKDLDLAGKRIAVIGSGATAYQSVPVLTRLAKKVTLFQRTPSWCFQAPGYLSEYPPQINWLDRNFPYLVNFVRFKASWQTRAESLLDAVMIDPDYRDDFAVSKANKAVLDMCMEFIDRKFGHDPELKAKMTPPTPPLSTRPVLVDPEYSVYDVIASGEADLVTEGIDRITPTGIRTADGEERAFDVIALATGFKANDYLWPMDIRGRGGRTPGDLWSKDGARAYLGTMLPGFPNFFMICGPNMNPMSTGLGIVDFQEMAARFAFNCIQELILEGRKSVDITDEAYERFAAAVDERMARMVYTDPRNRSYYRNKYGRSSVNNVFHVRMLWNWMRDPANRDETVAAQAGGAIRPFIGDDLVMQ
jgi:4-hydroxyacetophenone monooxygenase